MLYLSLHVQVCHTPAAWSAIPFFDWKIVVIGPDGWGSINYFFGLFGIVDTFSFLRWEASSIIYFVSPPNMTVRLLSASCSSDSFVRSDLYRLNYPSVCTSVCWLACWSVGRWVFYNFLKRQGRCISMFLLEHLLRKALVTHQASL